MSKLRPSKRNAGSMAASWLRRVFHNTYTRNGKRIAVQGWSVKLQYHGKRRTFALASQDRQAAAAEARAIYETLAAEGWDEAARQFNKAARRTFPKTDIRYWRDRLLFRSHPGTGMDGREHELSAFIEHGDSGWFFPLGAKELDAASQHALAIYRAVIEEGWNAVLRKHRREITLGFQWGYDPLLWTYTTLHTLVGKPPAHLCQNSKSGFPFGRIQVIEDDPGIRRALEQYFERNVRFTAERKAGRVVDPNADLCLVNRDLAPMLGLSSPGQIGVLPVGVPALTYGVHAHSEELFALTPGGLSGYVLKRVPPERMLEPLQGVLGSGRMPGNDAPTRSARSYFQRLLESDSSGAVPTMPGRLTRREQDVLNLISKGYLNKEIASALGISVWTVHEHVKRIFDKLQVHSRTEAVLAYLQK